LKHEKGHTAVKKYIYFDSGTTNTRIYFIDDGHMKAMKSEKIGTLDNVTSGDRQTLLRGLKYMYDTFLNELSVSDADIDGIYMSGMATSKNGIHEVDYLRLPVDLNIYQNSVHTCHTPLFDRVIGYLTGLVYRPDRKGTLENIECFNNVRGEEIELFGIMDTYSEFFAEKKTAVIMPGSHTHILYVENKKIVEITSCMGGEMFAAMAAHTILSASVSLAPDVIEAEALIKGCETVKKYGVNRALYITRALDLFTDENINTRNSYLEGVINSGVIIALAANDRFADLDYVAVAGNPVYFQIFAPLLSTFPGRAECIEMDQSGTDSFALHGFIQLINREESL